MRRLTLFPIALLVLACAKGDVPPADTAAATGTVAPATLSLSQLAGKWDVRAMREGSDSTLVSYVLTATGDRDGWSMSFPNRPEPVAIRVVDVAGDSVIVEAGPYESVLRPGVQVSTRTVNRLQDGKLIGSTVARYSGPNAGADTVLNIRSEGTRAN